MSGDILQTHLPHAPWMEPQTWKMPGTRPMDPATWLLVDEAFAGQMALREALISQKRDAVHALLPEGRAAAVECLEAVLAFLDKQPGYRIDGDIVLRPVSVQFAVDRGAPLITLGRLIQEDICLMEAGPDGHILTGALLCFPAFWTLSEKIGRPLVRIHEPVSEYDDGTARRVQRLFDGIQVGRPMTRANAHLNETADLFTPRRENEPPRTIGEAPPFLRSERQTLTRLPKSNAVVFAIHTYTVRVEDLTEEQRTDLKTVRLKTVS